MTTERFTIRHCAVAITGASGAAYGLRLVKELLGADQRVTLLLTTAGRQVVQHEVGLKLEEAIAERRRQVQDHFASIAVDCVANDDYFSGLASGSAAPDVMVVAPCSMGTAGRIAAGLSNNLIERAADVMLKEKRPLILVPRETPLNTIHLENLLRLASAGAIILPAMPAFYHNPPSIEALIDFVVGKILDQIGIAHRLYARWGESQE